MNRFAMRAHFRTEIADQAPVAKVSLLEKVELNIEPVESKNPNPMTLQDLR